jgi:putative tryptophan/tyrosine transport system substrate-binding protein
MSLHAFDLISTDAALGAEVQGVDLRGLDDGFFTNWRVQLISLAARHAIPAAYGSREIAEAGGLITMEATCGCMASQVGVYCGSILKGAKPVDLPVVQASKFELVINVESARMLGLTVPDKLLAAADEVIE